MADDTYQWSNPGTGGLFDSAADWVDTTNTSNVAFPGSSDTALLIGSDGAVQTITGPGDVGVLNVSGENFLAGAYTINQGLTIGGTGSGTLALGGTMSLVEAAQTLNYGAVVGNSGTGALVVSGSGVAVTDVHDNGLAVGLSADSVGTVLVSGGGTITFGSNDSDQLAAVSIGRGGAGEIAVDGAGSQLVADGGVYVGRGGAGALVVSNSGLVTETLPGTYFEIGVGNSTNDAHVGGFGSATVETGGTLATQGFIRVGGNGVSGALTVSTGGLVSAVVSPGTTGISLGTAGTADGSFETGSGSLEIDAGGTVDVGGAAAPDTDAGLSVGTDAGATGTADISGAGAVLDTENNLIVIGSGGTGTMNVSGGAAITASAPGPSYGAIVLGNLPSASGTLSVSGTGSTATAIGALSVGFGGQGSLGIASGGAVTASDVLVGAFAGTGQAAVGTSSTLASTGGFSVGGTAGAVGVLDMTGGDAIAAAGFTVSATGTVTGSGTLDGTVANAGSIAANGGVLTLTQAAGGAGTFAIETSSDLVMEGTVAVGAAVTFAGADARLDVTDPVNFGGTVDNFGFSDTLFAAGAASVSLAGSALSLFDSADAQIGTIALSNVASGGHFVDTGGTITLACFAAGTRLATPDGDVPVETLAAGDAVLTAAGMPAEVRWVGHRHLDCARQPRPEEVWPVRIAAGAFGERQPARDLWLSPDHAVFVAGCLIPVRHLLNGRTIAQQPRADVTYFHVELARHDVLLAEGLPCESYLDTGNRSAFANGGAAVQLHPDFSRSVWDARACARLVLEGAEVTAARRRLLRRAVALGHRRTNDPGLRALADGRAVPSARQGRVWHIGLPAGTSHLCLLSRTWIPAHTRPTDTDTRKLGVAIRRLWLDGRQVALDSPGLAAGWHAPELGWRWTDGAADLAIPGVRELTFEVAMSGSYWRLGDRRELRAA